MPGAEEDFVKCLRPTYLGDFGLKGKELRLKGQNRIGNLIVENQNYCDFEDWIKVSAPPRFCSPTRQNPQKIQVPLRWITPVSALQYQNSCFPSPQGAGAPGGCLLFLFFS